jgi:hypothetical protein
MAQWSDVVKSAPEFAALARRHFEAGKHLTLATLRTDGSPRISAIEIEFVGDDAWLGSMWQSRKALDLRRDPRFALHSPTAGSDDWAGDAKLSGRAEEILDDARRAEIQAASEGEAPPGPFHLFRCDISEVVVTRVAEGDLLIELWRDGDVRRMRPGGAAG